MLITASSGTQNLGVRYNYSKSILEDCLRCFSQRFSKTVLFKSTSRRRFWFLRAFHGFFVTLPASAGDAREIPTLRQNALVIWGTHPTLKPSQCFAHAESERCTFTITVEGNHEGFCRMLRGSVGITAKTHGEVVNGDFAATYLGAELT